MLCFPLLFPLYALCLAMPYYSKKYASIMCASLLLRTEHLFCPKLCRYIATVFFLITVEPPNKDHLGEMAFVPCREAGPISEASFLSPYFTILYTYIATSNQEQSIINNHTCSIMFFKYNYNIIQVTIIMLYNWCSATTVLQQSCLFR